MTASPEPTANNFIVEYLASSTPVARPVTQLTFQNAPSTEPLECRPDRCYGVSATSTAISFTALVNGRAKSGTVQVTVLPFCAATLRRFPNSTVATSSCIDASTACYGPRFICLVKLTEDERRFVRDSVMLQLQDSANVPLEHRSMCADLASSFRHMLSEGKVYMGWWNTPHTANTTNGLIHVDQTDFDHYRSQSSTGRSILLAVYLHETVHYLNQVFGRYTNHGPQLNNGSYSEYPYSVLTFQQGNPCVRF